MDKRDFDRKARALQDLAKRGKLMKTDVGKRGKVTRNYRDSLIARAEKRWGRTQPEKLKRFKEKVRKMQVDHVQDLQVGGKDLKTNMGMLNPSVNGSIGRQIQNQITNVPLGTKITGVKIK